MASTAKSRKAHAQPRNADTSSGSADLLQYYKQRIGQIRHLYGPPVQDVNQCSYLVLLQMSLKQNDKTCWIGLIPAQLRSLNSISSNGRARDVLRK